MGDYSWMHEDFITRINILVQKMSDAITRVRGAEERLAELQELRELQELAELEMDQKGGEE